MCARKENEKRRRCKALMVVFLQIQVEWKQALWPVKSKLHAIRIQYTVTDGHGKVLGVM
jgi:hypothetical protein